MRPIKVIVSSNRQQFGDLWEVSASIHSEHGVQHLTKTYPADFWRSHFRFLWDQMGAEFERANKPEREAEVSG